ncbi:hypothetical protein L210DRAFT_3420544 [Boletus edulis BED1]|uniref:Uncharacterized protein n=1 Tax=Boletus edulis BED1 TaxID=1328754 RepID=A0AAD4BG69_BOLED|nr:hypothetical protein L210DRAFT_3420544 [Boletus edulis BED1]
MYCGRPRNRYETVPTILLHPVFGQFVHDCETVIPGPEDNHFAERLADVASGFFDNEASRVEAIDGEFREYHLPFTPTQMSKSATSRVMCVNGHHCSIVQYKNEMAGTSSEAYHQAINYYFEWTRQTALAFWTSPLPCLLVIILGPYIAFAGAAWNQRPTIQMLSDFVALNFHPLDSLRCERVARHMIALRNAIGTLKGYYEALLEPSPSSPSSKLSRLFPHPSSYISLQDGSRKSFQYTDRFSRLLFSGIQDGDPICIKFVQSYGLEAHKYLAELGCAPTLRGFESIGGGWCFVVMDMLSGYQTLQDYQGSELKPSVVEAIHESLRLFHQAGYVHGDIRDTNIMVSEPGDHLMIVDLDWGGNAGVARYPARVNFEEIERPLDARDGSLITKEHDHFMINTIKVLQNTTARCC